MKNRLMNRLQAIDCRLQESQRLPRHRFAATCFPSHQSPVTSHHARRGILLLVVLSLLVLFAMIAVTFVLISGQYKRSSRANARAEQYAANPRKQLDAIFAQIVRDTANPNSVLQTHSLLNDLYGNDGMLGQLQSAANVPSGTNTPFMDLNVTITTFPAHLNSLTMEENLPGLLNGCVLTMTSGPAANLSTRILGYYKTFGGATIRVKAFEWTSAQAQSDFFTGTNLPWNFVINGRPFNGTGAGFNADTVAVFDPNSVSTTVPNLSTMVGMPETGAPSNYYALLPNPKFFVAETPPSPTSYSSLDGLGGADEDYEAPDVQNMFLAYMPLNPAPLGAQSAIIPSYHRRDLINYWINKGATADILRKVSLRPLQAPTDHPNFTGSNPTFNAVNGPWDVDNDGDGIPDSVWVDVGLPVQTAADGRRFKPLAAMLILDQDGRLNLNAHGSTAQLETEYAASVAAAPYNWPPAMFPAGMVPAPPRGQGYGPAEVNLLRAVPFTPPMVANLLGGNGTLGVTAPFYPGRYGEPSLSQYVPGTGIYPNPSAGGNLPPLPGMTAINDPLALLKQFEYPYAGMPNGTLTAFGSAPDFSGRGFVCLDVRGTPLTPYMGNIYDTTDSPYELNLYRPGARANVSASASGPDAPFTPAELERILRIYDIDAAALPDRLRQLLVSGGLSNVAAVRNLITTDSHDLPVPAFGITGDQRRPAGRAAYRGIDSCGQSIVNMLAARFPLGTPPTPQQLAELLPQELISGLRMDINRPLGNGRDDNPSNGIVDEPAEAANGEDVWFANNLPAAPVPSNSMYSFATVPFDHTNEGSPSSNAARQVLARHLQARHLYVLMLLLHDVDSANPATFVDFDGENLANTYEETVRGFAQWAINVVDFRDSDSIMTPFEYDKNPFNGWDVDGNPGTTADPAGLDRDVVWGCERPELRITETLAFHDRRTEDLGTDDSTRPAGHKQYNFAPDVTNQDSTFDQRLAPIGAAFIELYNPWTTQGSSINATGYPNVDEVPGEFYDRKTPNPTGVRLDARVPLANGNIDPTGSPVWRLLVVKGPVDATSRERRESSDPDPTKRPITNTPAVATDDIERSVYFTDISSLAVPIGFHGQPYYTSSPVDPLLPGRYAVVGSAGFLDPVTSAEYVTPIGRPVTLPGGEGADYRGNYRKIVLKPNLGTSVNQFELWYNNSPTGITEPNPIGMQSGGPASATVGAQPVVAAAINYVLDPVLGARARSFSISEPTSGYTTDTSYGVESGWVLPKDIPIDNALILASPTYAIDFGAVSTDGSKANFRTIQLQRLANPLATWHVDSNPYLTIDTMSIDLTVFNGVYQDPGAQPALPAPVAPNVLGSGFASLQLGDNDSAPPGENNLWRHESPNTLTGPLTQSSVPNQVFTYFLQNTLGYLNKFAPSNFTAPSLVGNNASTNAYDATNPNGSRYIGCPNARPFPWLMWNNRPFVSNMELMLVPRSRSSRLLFDYQPLPPTNFYNVDYSGPRLPVGHLLNFFATKGIDSTHGPENMYRLLEYVHVPSRFVGTEQEIKPSYLAATETNEVNLLARFHPPNNTISNYREPGRININTIPSDDASGNTSQVWNALLNDNSPGPPAFAWNEIMASRRGYSGAAGTPELSAHQTSTSQYLYFLNPFRSFTGVQYTLEPLIKSPAVPARNEAEVTLLRSHNADGPGATDKPMFVEHPVDTFQNTNRDPYFRFENLTRMSNSITTHSNVYAVWITVGYFEVTPAPTPVNLAIYPDGYQLSAELGSDSGEVVRHRGFYMYDRSIPVGFEPGQDHNFENGILVKRFIE